jgi:aspartyl-tRNA(Asn)/glutamyl-tRNA(Gln) amidotransferase subunit C
MADSLTLDDVDRVAALAHLELTGEEREELLGHLNDILGYARQIQQIDTTGVPPTGHVLVGHTADRPDEPAPSLSVDAALAAAPDPALDVGLFRVPRVIAPTEPRP